MRELIGKGLLTAAAASSVLSLSGGYAQATNGAAAAAGSPGLLSGNSVQAPVEIPVNVCGNTVNPVGVGNPAFGNSCANASGAHATSKPRPAHQTRPQAPHAEPAPHTVPAQASRPAPPRATHDGHGTDAGSTHAAKPAGNGGGSAPATTHGHRPGGGTHEAPAGHSGRPDHSGSSASGAATNSPGVLTGNLLQAPLHIPLNLCGNTVDLIGVLNPAFGNACVNGTDSKPQDPHTPVDPPHPGEPTDPRNPPRPPGNPSPPVAPENNTPMLPEQPRPVEEGDFVDQLAATGSDVDLLASAAVSAGLLISGGILYRRSRTAPRR
ncbi:chaplin family protein [Streptomyces sp. NPDC058653]|uniref:chaplin family protein n=1 Tax=Streptomyces sp. NPDC058653 TaxID=3346576 RepID=UPI00364CFBD9